MVEKIVYPEGTFHFRKLRCQKTANYRYQFAGGATEEGGSQCTRAAQYDCGEGKFCKQHAGEYLLLKELEKTEARRDLSKDPDEDRLRHDAGLPPKDY